MQVATAEEMRHIDKRAIEKYGIPGIVLMEHAAEQVTDRCISYLETRQQAITAVFCGTGNNGGDGFAIARMLLQKGYEVHVIVAGEEAKIKGDARTNLDCIKGMSIPIFTLEEVSRKCFKQYSLAVDAVLGTGMAGEIRGAGREAVRIINSMEAYCISVDIPSGICSDTGRVLGEAVKADETVTFVLPKRGLLLYPGTEYTGRLSIADIGMPKEAVLEEGILYHMLTPEEAAAMLPKRIPRSNKGSFGKVFALAGSETMLGAAYLTCKSAYRTGAGLVYACLPEKSIPIMQGLLPEAVEIPVTEARKSWKQASAIVMGPGLGTGKEAGKLVYDGLKQIAAPMVLDADGLNIVSGHLEWLSDKQGGCIVTPHPGEMGRLTGRPVSEILDHITETACQFANAFNVITVLKDARTVIAHPDGRMYINTTGCAAMAKGGSGDVLSGVIGGLLAQGKEPFDAAVLGVYLHGLAGMLAAEKIGGYGVLAGEIADQIPQAIVKTASVSGAFCRKNLFSAAF